MRRIALVLALLALTLGAPVAWLVARSLEAERFQRDVRHETVANRIFDEMERALSELLLAEEARPFEAYRGDGLARLLAEDALGLRRAYFERGPDGALRARSRSPGPATPPEDGATGRLGRRETVEEREQEEPAKDVHETKRLAKAEPAATDVRQQIREGLDRPHRRDRPGEAPHAALAGAPPAPAAREPTAEEARPEPARRAPLPGVAPTAGRPAARRSRASDGRRGTIRDTLDRQWATPSSASWPPRTTRRRTCARSWMRSARRGLGWRRRSGGVGSSLCSLMMGPPMGRARSRLV